MSVFFWRENCLMFFKGTLNIWSLTFQRYKRNMIKENEKYNNYFNECFSNKWFDFQCKKINHCFVLMLRFQTLIIKAFY